MDADVVVVGAGLAGLVATCELADAGRSVVLLDQESEANLGGQAWWSFGGLFLVDSPEQRRMGITDSFELAWQDWEGTAGWDRLTQPDGSPGPDHWGRRWGRAYVEWAAGEKRSWLRAARRLVLPRRRLGRARRRHERRPRQLGAALPHPVGHGHRCRRAVRAQGARARRGRAGHLPAAAPGRPARAQQRRRHRACAARCSRPTTRPAGCRATARWSASSSTAARRSSSPRAASAATTSWCAPTGPSGSAPRRPTCSPGCRPTSTAGCSPSPRRPVAPWSTATGCGTTSRGCATGTRSGRATPSASCPGRARCGSTPAATGSPPRTFPASTPSARSTTCGTPGSTTRGSSSTASLAGKEFALSGSEQNLDLTQKRYRDVLRRPVTKVTPSVQAFLDHGEDWLTAATIGELVAQMNALTPAGAPARPGAHRAAGRRARPAGREPLHQGRPGRRDPGRPRLPRRQAHQARLPAAPHPRPEVRPPRRRAAAGALAQDARRPAHRPVGAGARPVG